jgi:hypothetical protein
MPSQYDGYWQSKLEAIAQILRDAYENRISREIAVSDIGGYGNRENWYGVVTVHRNWTPRNELAHARSLGRIVLENRLLEPYEEETRFRLVISRNLRLRAERSAPPHPVTPRVEPQVYISIHRIVESLPLHGYPLSRTDLPNNGLYFFYEEGERFSVNGQLGDRIVRIGTHREQDRLPDRILNHFRGDRNTSIFRRLLGSAIIQRENPSDPRLQQWLEQGTPTLTDIEERVSRELREHFSFRCVKVEDRDGRMELEERLIATLARCSTTYPPSPNWLGLFAASEKVRESGIWNDQHVDSQRYMREDDLSRLERLVHDDWVMEQCLRVRVLNLDQQLISEILALFRTQERDALDLDTGFLRVRRSIEGLVETLARNHDINISRVSFFEKTRRLEEREVLTHSIRADLNFVWEKASGHIHRPGTEEQQRRDLRECIKKLRDIILALCGHPLSTR